MVAILICVSFFFAITLVWYWRRKRVFTFFKDRGIPGPQPNFLIGNLADVHDGLSAAITKWGETYGRTFGYFEGPTPILVTSDIEILRQIFIKDFHLFAARKRFAIQASPDDHDRVHLFFSDGARWKRQRCVMVKAFSVRKLKMMTPIIHKSVQSMMQVVDKQANENDFFDIYPVLQCLTLEIIMSVGFGVDFDAQRETDNIFLLKCRSVFTDNMPMSGKRPIFFILVMLSILFPSWSPIMHRLHVYFHEKNIDPDATFWFEDAAGRIINQRRHEKKPRIDFIQLMQDSVMDSDSDSTGSETDDDNLTMTLDPGDDTSSGVAHRKCPIADAKKYFTFEEMKSNCQLFLLAGYETTSTALAYIIYELALNQDAQKTLFEEIIAHLPDGAFPSYQELKTLKYLDMFVFETFRLHPIAPFVVGRTCLQDTTIKGLHIPKGQGIMANVFALQFDPECWEDPDIFRPERFRRELRLARDPMYYLTFGAGPRNCLGMRFALHEIRIAVSEIVRKYQVLPCRATEIPLQTTEVATVIPKNGMPVTLKRRDTGTS